MDEEPADQGWAYIMGRAPRPASWGTEIELDDVDYDTHEWLAGNDEPVE